MHVLISDGSYNLQADGEKSVSFEQGTQLEIKVQGGRAVIYKDGKSLGSYSNIVLNRSSWGSEFKLKPTVPNQKQRIYQDNLLVKVRKGKLLLINEVAMENYVAGVVESEAGSGRTSEFYKAQAIISRTYALANKSRHQVMGFHLCDQVHCQVYHGKARYDEKISQAATDTRKHVIVDHNIQMITAAFHSNCGGHTINAEHVWSKPLPYLVGKPDTFCLTMSQSHWEKEIEKQRWLDYLENQGFALDSLGMASALGYFPSKKQEYFDDSLDIHVAQIRQDMGLRSAWFTVHEDHGQVMFTGRGFGHGVGLCQEGAIRMGQLGYSYSDILHHYYTDVHVVDLNYLEFFRE